MVANQGLTSESYSTLETILEGKTFLSSSGFPCIAESSFSLFLKNVPHLFKNGLSILQWLDQQPIEGASQERAKKVLTTIVNTAAVTAPTDLWLLKHLLSGYHQLELTSPLLEEGLNLQEVAQSRGLDLELMNHDFSFFKSRGVVVEASKGVFKVPEDAFIRDLVGLLPPYDSEAPVDLVETLSQFFKDPSGPTSALATRFLTIPETSSNETIDWRPSLQEVEIGSRLVPAVLALRILQIHSKLSTSRKVSDAIGQSIPVFEQFLHQAGLCDENGVVNALGGRVFERGAGPMGIVHAYHTYLTVHLTKLKQQEVKTWVQRGANVAASQDANAKTFRMANDALDRYCHSSGFQFDVFIEHAVGQGEATRQRFERTADRKIHFFGADLEDAAIDQAIKQQQAGRLPENMKFVRNADIGEPSIVVDALAKAEVKSEGAVMIVGNGFHEIREQTDDKMIQTFTGYAEAGIIILFTEESGLTDDDLINTGFNTYHAGFRYVHEISGQGLRPAYDHDTEGGRLSWKTCAEKGGYKVLEEYTSKTRTIYPHKKDGRNPAISITYFCVPQSLHKDDA